jgi:hypothetical protein
LRQEPDPDPAGAIFLKFRPFASRCGNLPPLGGILSLVAISTFF